MSNMAAIQIAALKQKQMKMIYAFGSAHEKIDV